MNPGYCLFTALAGFSVFCASTASASVDLTRFDSNHMISDPTIVECTLATGVADECAEFVVKYKPENIVTGPYCPETLDDEGGIWAWDGEEAGLYRLNGEFFDMLARLGLDFSDDGKNINIADPAAGPPQSDHACLEATEDAAVEITVRIPLEPSMATTPTDLGTVAKVGLALDGVPIFADAPSVLQTGHLPALDTCGGHIDPGGWYHWHATATDIDSIYEEKHIHADCELPQSASAMFGYALDGYAMYGSADSDGSVPSDLDACNGHVGVTDDTGEAEYHYHATAEFPNLPACLSGVLARDNFSTTARAGIGSAGGPGGGGHQGGHGMPGLDEVASTLGVDEDELMQALQGAGGPGPQMDIDAAASALGISAAALRKALPGPPGR